MRYIVFTTKGLEQVSVSEINHTLKDASIIEVKTKRIVFTSVSNLKELPQLRTVDDIGILVGRIETAQLEEIITTAESLDFEPALTAIKKIRDIGDKFSITATIAKVRSYTSSELLQELNHIFERKLGLRFSESERSDFDIRVFIDGSEVYFSVRLTETTLHNRKYKTHSKEGSLKSTIAAAMVQLICQWRTNLEVVDNFCGSGTILAETLLARNEISGGDIDSESVQITLKNLSNLNFKQEGRIRVLDATHTNWSNNYFDCAISNLPWGKQVEIESITNLYIGAMREYQRILKPNGKLCLLVSNPELLIKYAKQYFPNHKVSSIKIGYLGQSPSIVVIS